MYKFKSINTQSTEQTVDKEERGKMKIMGFSASPRKEGNTAWIVNKILEGAKEQGAETQSWCFSDLDIKPCQGCFGCHKGDQGCVINDDMQKLNDAIEYADLYGADECPGEDIHRQIVCTILSAIFSIFPRRKCCEKKADSCV